ncbi:glucose-methanol-choline oxidoreductase [Caballeronia udeis]|uniref:Glucose-methanol-choline oxidoreductase n=1 Tax=Caballeronia udeis TaxID=1232866 RepID=A0A158GLD8_9BURK|nr:GMC family oxidoreductase N-terminal domain-containing protein [Caballeronia udeis]SAL32938.1 glucose-methanol-choline oxidoreductase [Caballeronia udeis]
MSAKAGQREFDVIVIGSGTCGGTIAKELALRNKRVLILERGANPPLKETLGAIVSIADRVILGDRGLSTVRALTTGGSTSLYFAVVNYPQLDTFRTLGIDLAGDLAAIRNELPIGPLPDSLLNPQGCALSDSARALGYDWHKFDMLVDASRCTAGYAYDAKWKAKSSVQDALANGAVLMNGATVSRILVDGERAVGVEYKLRKSPFGAELRKAYAKKIVLAAGELATPKILRDTGVEGIGARGFYCNPGYAIYGLVPGLKGTDGFVGSAGCQLDAGIELSDANIVRALHRPMMVGGMKLKHLFAFPETIGIGVKVKDGLGGQMRPNGRLHKTFDQHDRAKLDRGRQAAVKILEKAGAKDIVDFGVTAAGRVGGLVRIQEHVDSTLETQFRGLHVCDGSVLPDDMRGTPTVSLVCLAKYLSRHLLSAL